MNVRRPILIDTDLSFDDYIALLFLLQHPAVEVRAITLAANGVAHIQPAVENISRLLSYLGRLDIPVAQGRDRFLSGRNDFPVFWRYILDYLIRVLLPRSKARPWLWEGDAIALIRQQILASSVPVTIVALAPLTNLALALQGYPDLVRNIETIVVSGGAFNVPGTIHASLPKNPNAVSEWNFYTDPLAAKVVLQSGARIALVPLDVTDVNGSSPLLFSRSMIQALRSAARGNASRLLARMVYLWQLTSNQPSATPVWDAAVAALAVNPQLGAWKELKVGVAQQPQAIAGQTYEATEGPSVRVCYAGNRQAFEETYLNLVSGKLKEQNLF